jgi:hypothetical protein
MGRANAIIIGLALFGWSSNASALDCSGWQRLNLDQKTAQVQRMIDRHFNSNVGKRYTSENTVRMRRCMTEFAEDIREEFDGACAVGLSGGKKALDDLFDRYFLSCAP